MRKYTSFKGWPCTQITEFQADWGEALESSQAPFYSQKHFRPKNLYAGWRAFRAHEGHLTKSVPAGLSQDQKPKTCSTAKHSAFLTNPPHHHRHPENSNSVSLERLLSPAAQGSSSSPGAQELGTGGWVMITDGQHFSPASWQLWLSVLYAFGRFSNLKVCGQMTLGETLAFGRGSPSNALGPPEYSTWVTCNLMICLGCIHLPSL